MIHLWCRLFKRGCTLTLESGVALSISRLACKKFAVIQQTCNRQLGHIDAKIKNRWLDRDPHYSDLKLRSDLIVRSELMALVFNKYRSFYVLTFYFPSTSFQVLAHGWWLNVIVTDALAMQFEDAFKLCRMVFHEEQLVATEKVDIQPILAAIKHNVDPSLATIVYPSRRRPK
jgi:hypothetical protein